MIGQLKSVHDQITNPTIPSFVQKYDYDVWTEKVESVVELLYLGNACRCFGLVDRNKNTILVALTALPPTLSPEDPNLFSWWEEHKAEWEDKEILEQE